MKILILGATGMLGNAMFRVMAAASGVDAYATARSAAARQYFSPALADKLILNANVEDHEQLAQLFADVNPQVVINCIGLVKQLADANNPLHALPINSMLPHRLAALCESVNARLIHISTDCVFSGKKGNYLESDQPDAYDLYGRSKLLGEVDCAHAVTLRTSIIGHELSGQHSLLNWFLAQNGTTKGFTRAIFSGLPTVELATLIRDYVLPHPTLRGLYHVAAAPIAKYDLLQLIAKHYSKEITITPDDALVIDRSLNAARFNEATGYTPPAWPELIARMHAFH
jgi:dTDP-4-dehydrorhamnose reductase